MHILKDNCCIIQEVGGFRKFSQGEYLVILNARIIGHGNSKKNDHNKRVRLRGVTKSHSFSYKEDKDSSTVVQVQLLSPSM
jgi:hypothetical protein